MKPAWIAALVLVSAPAIAFAQTPSRAPLAHDVLASILGQTTGQPPAGSCGGQQTRLSVSAPPPAQPASTCSITATCTTGTVSCTGSSSCGKVNSDCNVGIQGFVNCDGNVTWCPQCACGSLWCCQCAQTGDCLDCCRCEGGTFGACIALCG
jgi:hypothetical protein